MKKNLEYNEALNTILAHIHAHETELISIEHLHNRVAAKDISAVQDIPPFNNSAMDGFAVHSEDLKSSSNENPVTLEIEQEIFAGEMPCNRLKKGFAAKIMTGAPLPSGANAVVKKEDTELEGNKVRIFVPVSLHKNVRFSGEDIRKGELFIHKGELLTPARIGMLAAQNIIAAKVYRKPVVGILATGSEILEPGKILTPGKIRDSISLPLAGLVEETHCVHRLLGIIGDTQSLLEKKLRSGLSLDALITIGGVSVGDRDLVIPTLENLGVEIVFWKSKIKPGKPIVFGTYGKTAIFGLPGNPVSSMVTFEIFVRMALLKMQGMTNIFRQPVKTVMDESFYTKTNRLEFIRAITRYENGHFISKICGSQGSGRLHSMVVSNSLVVIPDNYKNIHKGESFSCILFNSPLTDENPWLA